jgi:hypothetical protein
LSISRALVAPQPISRTRRGSDEADNLEILFAHGGKVVSIKQGKRQPHLEAKNIARGTVLHFLEPIETFDADAQTFAELVNDVEA